MRQTRSLSTPLTLICSASRTALAHPAAEAAERIVGMRRAGDRRRYSNQGGHKIDRREDVVIREVQMKGIMRKILEVPTLWDSSLLIKAPEANELLISCPIMCGEQFELRDGACHFIIQ